MERLSRLSRRYSSSVFGWLWVRSSEERKPSEVVTYSYLTESNFFLSFRSMRNRLRLVTSPKLAMLVKNKEA